MMNLCAEAKVMMMMMIVMMIIMMMVTQDAGIKTLVALDDQGEQIDKIEAGLDSINADMGLAEKALKAMDLACGIFPKFWKKSEGFKEDDAIWGEQKGGGGGAPPPQGIEIPSGAFVAKITNDDREAEMEENMEQVSSMKYLINKPNLEYNPNCKHKTYIMTPWCVGERHGREPAQHGQ